MSVCEYLPSTSASLSNLTQPFRTATQPGGRRAHDDYRCSNRAAAVTYLTQATPKASAGPGCHTFSYGDISLGGFVASSRRQATSSFLDLVERPKTATASADMEHRNKHVRVTLPPLSSLTTSIDLDRRHEPMSSHYRDFNSSKEAVSLSDGATLRLGAQSANQGPGGGYQFQDRRRSFDPSGARMQRPGSAAYSAPAYSYAETPSTSADSSTHVSALYPSRSPKPPKGAARGIIESTRPRSYSSPHRHMLQNPPRRPSLADAFEVDQLLEALIYVQDINRRLGLNTGRPASPSIFQTAAAAEMLGNKVKEELNTMTLFSQSRADFVVHELGLPAEFATSRRNPQSSSGQPNKSTVPITTGSWPLVDSAERAQSSMGHLTLEEQKRPEFGSESFHSTVDADFESRRSTAHVGESSAYFSRTRHADPAQRTISRALSFEYPRTTPYVPQAPHYTEEAPADLRHYELRSPLERDSRAASGSTLVPPMYQHENRHQQQMELLDRRRLAGKGMKRVRKRKNEHHQECLGCQAKETPEWRKGPMGPRTLCNACGLLYAKLTKRKLQEAEAVAKASGKTAEEIVREREESPGAKQASLEALRAELNLANGMRNRATLPIAPQANTAQTSHSAVLAFEPARFYETQIDSSPHGQVWPSQQRVTLQPFAHQPLYHRPATGMPPAEQRPTENAIRPYSSGSKFGSHRYSDEHRVRSGSGRGSPVDHVDRFGHGFSHHRPDSPESSTVQGYTTPGPSQQRRHHPYL